MSEIFRIIPVDQRPYEWAYSEMKEAFPNPDKFRIKKLDELSISPNMHVSLFHTDEEGKPDIWRVYWHKTDSVKYSIVVNYDEMLSEHPDIVKLLINSGKAAYEAALEYVEDFENATGKTMTYKALDSIKKEEKPE